MWVAYCISLKQRVANYTAHGPNLASEPFLCNLGAKKFFSIFKELLEEKYKERERKAESGERRKKPPQRLYVTHKL